MISLDMKNETTSSSSSPLNLSTPKDEPGLSFSELLRGVSEKKDDKLIQNGSMILSLVGEEKGTKDSKSLLKGDTLLSLLKNEEISSIKTIEEPLELNPKLTSSLSTKEIKALVADAKNYLKEKIQNSDDFKMSQIKELPKTLKGLVEVAKKFGVDISKITVEEVKAHAEVKPKNIKQEDVKSLSAKDDAGSLQKEVKVKAAAVNDTEQDIDIKLPQDKKVATPELKEVKVKADATELKEVVQDKKVAAPELKDTSADKKTVTSDVKEVVQDKKVATSDIKDVPTDKKVQTPHAVEKEKSTVVKATPISQPEQVKEIKNDEKFTQIQKEVKATPLFKAQTVVEHTTTQQIVQVKEASSSLKIEQKTPKEKADETLKLLLRGEKPSMSSSSLTADFSVATAKVIAPGAASDATKSLEKLLHGDTSSAEQSGSSAKTEALTTHKADSFEVKLNEAKQMIKYLSNDVKTAIEDYKSPFTRVKVQLNPQKLGEVDLTVVQRGKNLHVNISSNNTAINTLSMNVNELRVQLNNSGINNASLNFNNSSQNSDSNASQQQNQQNRQNEQEAHEEYNYFGNEEANEEVLSSLEIIVPQYG